MDHSLPWHALYFDQDTTVWGLGNEFCAVRQRDLHFRFSDSFDATCKQSDRFESKE